MAWAPIAMMAVGTIMQMQAGQKAADAAEKQGRAVQASAYNTAAQMDQRAGQERASSQRKMLAERKRERMVQSSLQARAAASGAGASDPTVVDLAEDIAGEGEFRALSALYEGEERATGLEYGAKLKRFEGDSAASGASARAEAMELQSFASGLSSMGSMYGKYGGGGPSGGGASLGPRGGYGTNQAAVYDYQYY